MPGPKTNEREGTRAVLRYAPVSPYKIREVLDLVRGKPVHEAADILRFAQRDAAALVEKVLASAVANAQNNDHLDPEELYVSACFADEGPTAKRWRPRARGRASRTRKRSSHVTVIVSRLPEDKLARLQARRRAENLAMRARRVEATRRARAQAAEGANRRERRHPGAGPAEEAPAEEAGAEEARAEEAKAEEAGAEALAGQVPAGEGAQAGGTDEPTAAPPGPGKAEASSQAEAGQAGASSQAEAGPGPDEEKGS